MSGTSPVGLSASGPARDTPLAGWYHDPVEPGVVRWWDGRDWTAHVQRPAPAPAPPQPPAPAGGTPVAAGIAAGIAAGVATGVDAAAFTGEESLAATPPAGGSPAGAPLPAVPGQRAADILSETRAVARRSRPSRRTVAVAAAVTVTVVLAAGLGAWQLGLVGQPGGTAGPAVPADAQPVPVAMAANVSPRVGDCFTAPSHAGAAAPYQVGALGRLPCSARHVFQVFALASYTGPLPATPGAAYVAAEKHCPAPEGFLGDHVHWVERFGAVPIVGTSARAKGRTWVACAVALSGTTTFDAVPGSFQGVISAPGAMARYGLCSPSKPGRTLTLVPCRPNAAMWLLAELPLAPPGAAYPGLAGVRAAERAACTRYIAVTAPHAPGVAVPPSAAGWARGDHQALCFVPLDAIRGASSA